MYFSSGLAIAAGCLVGISAVAGVPLSTRDHINDGIILNYALTLEHLEDAFYRQGLENFTAGSFASFPPTLFPTLQSISRDERTHVGYLQTALAAAGIAAVAPCRYEFPVTTAEEFVLVAGVLEGVGVTAYLGAAASIADRLTLTAAGGILTIEARHSSLIRAARGQEPIPQPFDVPLGFNQVFSLASAFVRDCPPTNPPLPFAAFPALALVRPPAAIRAGDKIKLAPATPVDPRGLNVAFVTVNGPQFVQTAFADGVFEVAVPDGVRGQSYALLVKGREKVCDDTTVAGPVIIEIVA